MEVLFNGLKEENVIYVNFDIQKETRDEIDLRCSKIHYQSIISKLVLKTKLYT